LGSGLMGAGIRATVMFKGERVNRAVLFEKQ
jgi:hypothetical protein